MRQSQMSWILALALAPLPALGQTSQTAPAQQPAPQPEKKAKKVWTNDDLTTLPANSAVSTASGAPAAAEGAGAEAGAEKPAAKPGTLPPDKDPKVYKEKLDALRKQLADVEAKIKEAQDAISGSQGGSNAINLTQKPGTLRPEDLLASLQKQRDSIQQQIDDLESQARKNDISPGDIR
jgi:hypothetical protein